MRKVALLMLISMTIAVGAFCQKSKVEYDTAKVKYLIAYLKDSVKPDVGYTYATQVTVKQEKFVQVDSATYKKMLVPVAYTFYEVEGKEWKQLIPLYNYGYPEPEKKPQEQEGSKILNKSKVPKK